jgi:hypothetical protein
MRLYQNPEVREMHSSLRLQNVVAERDLQMQKIQSNVAAEREVERAFVYGNVRSVIDGEKKDQAKNLATKIERDKTYVILRAQIIDVKERAERQKNEEADLDKRLRDRADAAFRDNTAERKLKAVEETKLHESKLREFKKVKAMNDSVRESAMDERNKKFNDIQRFINEKRKEIQKDKIEERRKEIERVGSRGYAKMIKEQQGLRNFEQTFQISKAMEYETLNETEVERRRQYLQNANTMGDNRSQTYSKYKADDDLFLATWSKSRGNKPRPSEYRPSEEEKKAVRGVKARELQKHVRVQIADNAKAKAQYIEADVQVDEKNKAYLTRDDNDFARYGILTNLTMYKVSRLPNSGRMKAKTCCRSSRPWRSLEQKVSIIGQEGVFQSDLARMIV